MAVCLEFGTIPDWITAGIAGGALIYAHRQLTSNQVLAIHAADAARQEAALAAWNEYLKFCFENPEYSCADEAKKVIPGHKLKNLAAQGTTQAERYQWFLSVVLNSCEQVLLSMPADEDWEKTLVDQVWYHAEAVHDLWVGGWDQHYNGAMDVIVRKALKKAGYDA